MLCQIGNTLFPGGSDTRPTSSAPFPPASFPRLKRTRLTPRKSVYFLIFQSTLRALRTILHNVFLERIVCSSLGGTLAPPFNFRP